MDSIKILLFLTLTSFIITGCETPSSNENDDENNIEECGGSGEQSVGPCLIAEFEGTYTVNATAGSHDRGTIIIAKNGDIDYDTGLNFLAKDFLGVYDRLDCCMRVTVEMNQRDDNDTNLASDARHRVDIFTNSNSKGGTVVSFEYYPNWPSSDGKVELSIE
ncbi:MAG: hypothetical protein JXR20_11395 [Balneola sp.]